MSVVQIEKRIGLLEKRLNPDPETYILMVKAWGLGGNGSISYLLEKDGSPRGRFVRMLSKDEVKS